MKRLIIFIFSILNLNSYITYSQVSDPYSEIGLTIGTSYYIGDLNDQHFKLSRPATAFNYKTNLNRRFAIRGGLSFGEIRGSDKENNIDTAKFNRNLHFKSPLYEFAGIIEFNFFPYETGNKRYPFTPYIFSGLSIFNFNPQARKFDTNTPFDNDGNQSNNEWIDLQPLGTEGQYSSQYPEKLPYQLIQFAIPVGIGFKASLSENFSLAVEYGFRKTFTDYLDDVGGTYASPQYLFMENENAANLSDRSNALQNYITSNPGADITTWSGNTNRNRANENMWDDWYYFAGLTLSYKIYSKPKVCQY
ncbi:MAG: hypothetical protein CMP70_04315 [Flavobacteriales bacterium]|nr:hypothetical protein [Flavobacteriales bacterium]